MSRSLLILRHEEIRRVLDLASCLEAVEKAFTAYSTGGAELPAVINLDVPEHRGEIHVKAGHLRGASHYAVKFASGFYDNPARGLPQNDGLVLVFDAETGEPTALLLDNGFITDLRTGAARGVAARHLAREDSRVVGMDGTSNQELDVDILARTDLHVADSRTQCLRVGEIRRAVTWRAMTESRIAAELRDIPAGLKPGRVSPSDISVCDLTGIGVQD